MHDISFANMQMLSASIPQSKDDKPEKEEKKVLSGDELMDLFK